MAKGIGFNPDFDYLLDPQQIQPTGFCERCGGEIYGDYRRNEHDAALCDCCWSDLYID